VENWKRFVSGKTVAGALRERQIIRRDGSLDRNAMRDAIVEWQWSHMAENYESLHDILAAKRQSPRNDWERGCEYHLGFYLAARLRQYMNSAFP
jgi:hypothetical protein